MKQIKGETIYLESRLIEFYKSDSSWKEEKEITQNYVLISTDVFLTFQRIEVIELES